MGHHVEDDIDAHRVGFLFGKFAEVPFGFAFALPAITEVGVLADEDHEAIFVIEDAAVVYGFGILAFPGDS